MKNAGKACNNRLYRHIRTFEKIIKNYFVILPKSLFRVELSGRMVYDRKLDTSHMDDDIF